MLYKMYIQRYKPNRVILPEIFEDILKIYRENGVLVLGHWMNKKDSNETVLITVYKDEMHYQNFIDKMKTYVQYQERRKLLGDYRISFEVKDLEINKHSILQPSDEELSEYIKDVKHFIDEHYEN
ncbi:MAG: hypothetical protein ACW98K_06410 [Candidatus Kariarchaeaceae archaeon]